MNLREHVRELHRLRLVAAARIRATVASETERLKLLAVMCRPSNGHAIRHRVALLRDRSQAEETARRIAAQLGRDDDAELIAKLTARARRMHA